MAETKRARGAAARLAGAEIPRRRFTGVGSSAAPGLDSAQYWVREAVGTTANPPGHIQGAGQGSVRHAAARGDPRSPASRGNVVPARNWVKLCYWKQPCGMGELLWCLTRPMVSQGGGSTTAWQRCQATARKSSRAEGGKKGKQGLARVLTSSGSSYGGLIRRGRSAAADPRRRGGSVEIRRGIPVRGAG